VNTLVNYQNIEPKVGQVSNITAQTQQSSIGNTDGLTSLRFPADCQKTRHLMIVDESVFVNIKIKYLKYTDIVIT